MFKRWVINFSLSEVKILFGIKSNQLSYIFYKFLLLMGIRKLIFKTLKMNLDLNLFLYKYVCY